MSLLQTNTKLGKGIVGWSIPNIDTCPGATEVCRSLCYVSRYTNRFGIDYNDNMRTTRNGLVETMDGALLETGDKVVRIHVSGDFYSVEYIRKWIRIIQAHPERQFFAYTRSWRVEHMVPELEILAALPNMKLWASCDSETGLPNVAWSKAYLAVDDQDVPQYPVDLVFRNKRKTKMFRSGGAVVCPHEFGVKNKVTCTSCRRCLR